MEDNLEYIKQLENEVSNANLRANQSTQTMISSSMYNSQGMDQNLIVYQLEFDNIMDRLEHQLRGDVIKTDNEGNQFWSAPTKKIKDPKTGKEKEVVDEDLQTLNDYGVSLIMNTIGSYLNRNTVLSNYDIDRINEILYDLGNKIRIIIYCSYERMGLVTDTKRSRYAFIVMSVLHAVESAYRRALNGEESKGLRTARVVTQNDPMMNHQVMPQMRGGQNKFKLLNPKTWV